MTKSISFKIIVVILIAGAFFVALYFFKGNNNTIGDELISQIKISTDINTQTKLYTDLIEKVGPEKAQEELFRSGLPFTGQTHLLNHVVGDYLYEKYGPAGLVYCKDYFLSSCYHGFVLNVIGNGGMAEVAETFDECRKKGPAVSNQCAHAIGHGFLANAGYKNLTEALTACDQAVQDIPQFPAFNCYDGVFMENIWAVHDDGLPSPDRWVKKDDSMYPCNDKRIDNKYHLGCWSNQPSLMFQLFNGDLKKVGVECNKVTDTDNKKMCFNGLSRQIHPLTHGNIDAVFGICKLLPSAWVDYCVRTNAQSYFGVGDRELPFTICNRMNGSVRQECYQAIIGAMKNYNEDRKLCNQIEDETWRINCLQN